MHGITLLSMFLGCVSALPVYNRSPLNMAGGKSGRRKPDKGWNGGVGNGAGGGGVGNGAGGTGWNGDASQSENGNFVPSSSSWNGQDAGVGGNGNGYISSSASDGGTNLTPPTLPPGGDPTTASSGAVPLLKRPGSVKTIGIIMALGLVVGIGVGVGIYILKKNG